MMLSTDKRVVSENARYSTLWMLSTGQNIDLAVCVRICFVCFANLLCKQPKQFSIHDFSSCLFQFCLFKFSAEDWTRRTQGQIGTR